MKKIWIITSVIAVATATMVSCSSDRNPGSAYMPDMTYSKAYETYAPAQERLDNSEAKGVTFSGYPVPGTIARGESLSYPYKNDSLGYVLSASVKNPLDIAAVNMKEAERLYLINCGICHGSKLDGNGPLYNDGNGPYQAAPKNFMDNDMKAMAEGTMFHSVTYGKGQMGSYASQLTPVQRWEVIAYVKLKQGGGKATPGADSAAVAKN